MFKATSQDRNYHKQESRVHERESSSWALSQGEGRTGGSVQPASSACAVSFLLPVLWDLLLSMVSDAGSALMVGTKDFLFQ